MNDSSEQLSVTEEGFLELGDGIEHIIFHQNLNVFIVTTKNDEIRVYDPHTSEKLVDTSQKKFIARDDGDNSKSIQCMYSPKTGGVLFCGGSNVGFRKEYKGVILLDTILQTQVKNPEDNVTIELLLPEAWQLYQALEEVRGSEILAEVNNTLRALWNDAPTEKSTKLQKWKSVPLTFPQGPLKLAFARVVAEVRKFKRSNDALPMASLIGHRLENLLLGEPRRREIEKENMFTEAARLSTFADWPHMNYKWALPDQMAQAGFFHQPGKNNDDRAMCFICNVCLVYWEPTDEPWSEHERHSPTCPFVRGEYTHNVPMSVSHALSPAFVHSTNKDPITILSSGNCPKFVATATAKGSICLWDINKKFKKDCEMVVDTNSPFLMKRSSRKLLGYCDITNGLMKATGWGYENPTFTQATSFSTHDSSFSTFVDQHNLSAVNKLNEVNSSQLPFSGPFFDEEPVGSANDIWSVVPNQPNPNKYGLFHKSALGEILCPSRIYKDVKVSALCVFEIRSETAGLHSLKPSYLAVGVGLQRCTLIATPPPHSEVVSPEQPLDIMTMADGDSPKEDPPKDDPASSANKNSSELKTTEDFSPHILVYSLHKDIGTNRPNVPGRQKTPPPLSPTDNYLGDVNYWPGGEHGHQFRRPQPEVLADGSQCMKLPDQFSLPGANLIVNGMLIMPCGEYLLVSVMRSEPSATLPTVGPAGGLLLYELDDFANKVPIVEKPTQQIALDEDKFIPKVMVHIPSMIEPDYLENLLVGYVAIDGSIGIFAPSTMTFLFHKQYEVSPYTNLVYCNSLERLCGTKADGTVSLLQVLRKSDQAAEDDSNYHKLVSELCETPVSKESTTPSNKSTKDCDLQAEDLFVNKPLTETLLDQCLQLTHYQTQSPKFAVTAGPCWSEVVPTPKQRKGPFHMSRFPREYESSRHWKLDSSPNTVDDHTFGVVFPPSSSVASGGLQLGHFDIKIVFNTTVQMLPQIQVTLLKQNMKISAKSQEEDNATFLETHKGEILCGPVDVTDFINAAETSATVMMTSPLMMGCRTRNFIVHLNVLTSDTAKTRKPVWVTDKAKTDQLPKVPAPPATSSPMPGVHTLPVRCPDKDKHIFPPNHGHAIREIFICFKICKQTDISNDRLQRLALLEKKAFHQSLLSAISTTATSIHLKQRSLELFDWILISLTNSCSSRMETPLVVLGLLSHIPELIRSCILLGDRNLAHKCTRILVTAIQSQTKTEVGEAVLKGLLDCHADLLDCKSAGALHFYFTLLNAVKHCDQEATATKVTSLLCHVGPLLRQMDNPLHGLLESKFNLSGLPFEREIFEAQPIFSLKSASVVLNSSGTSFWPTVAPSHLTQHNVLSHLVGDPTLVGVHPGHKNCKHPATCNAASENSAEKNTFENVGLSGLLEVEPLHFIPHLASEGTKLEKVFAGSSYSGNPLLMQMMSPHANVAQSPEEYHPALNKLMTGSTIKKHNPKFQHKTDDLSTATSTDYSSDGSMNDGPSLAVMEGATSDDDEFLPLLPYPNMDPTAAEILMDYSVSLMDEFPAGRTHGSKKNAAKRANFPRRILSLPPQYVFVVDRMHSGAKKFVILDFGMPVVLTDVVIPASSDLSVVAIDVWLTGEDFDGTFIAASKDIGTKPLTLSDLTQPPVCRYIKISFVGRPSILNTQLRIPVGCFYGHTVVFPWLIQSGNNPSVSVLSKEVAQAQQPMLANMVEDLSCRYSLACSKLKNLLDPLLLLPSSHLDNERVFGDASDSSTNNSQTTADKNIFQAYQECILEQRHLNLVMSVLGRVDHYLGRTATPNYQQHTSADQLSTLLRHLLDCLLTLTVSSKHDQVPKSLTQWCAPKQAKSIVENICLQGTRGSQVETAAALLSRLCSAEKWWGEFLCATLTELFDEGCEPKFPTIRAFTLVTLLGHKTCEGGWGSELVDSVVKCFLSLFETASLLSNELPPSDPSLWWLLLFLSECLEIITSSAGSPRSRHIYRGRWSWMNAEILLKDCKGSEKSSMPDQTDGYRDRLFKRLSYHKQKLINLEAAAQSFGQVIADLSGLGCPKVVKESEAAFKRLKHQHALKHFKDLCSIGQHENSTMTAKKTSDPSKSQIPPDGDIELPYHFLPSFTAIDRDSAIMACKWLIKIVLTPPPIEIDTFILVCRVIGGLMVSTRPSLGISEVLTMSQLESLLCQTIALDRLSGRQWAVHALTCMLQGAILEEQFYGAVSTVIKEQTNFTDTTKQSGTASDEHNSEGCDLAPNASSSETSANLEPVEFAKMVVHPDPNPEMYPFKPLADKFAALGIPPEVGLPTWGFEDVEHMLEKNGFCDESTDDDSNTYPDVMFTEDEAKYQMALLSMQKSIWSHQKKKAELASEPSISSSKNCVLYDHRLAKLLSLQCEHHIAALYSSHIEQLHIGLTEPLKLNSTDPIKEDHKVYTNSGMVATSTMLSDVFGRSFCSLTAMNDHRRLEILLEVWLNLNFGNNRTGDNSEAPIIPLSPTTVSAIIAAAARCGALKIRAWSLLLRVLTMCSEMSPEQTSTSASASSETKHSIMASHIINDVNLPAVILKLLKGDRAGIGRRLECRNDMVGYSLVKLFDTFLVSLIHQCTFYMKKDNKWKLVLLDILQTLMQDQGSIWIGSGPLDAQKAYIDLLLLVNYDNIRPKEIYLSVLNGVASVVHNFVFSPDNNPPHINERNSSMLGGLFASVLGSEGRQGLPVTRQGIVCSLLQLACRILNLNTKSAVSRLDFLPKRGRKAAECADCDTDETKAMKDSNPIESNAQDVSEDKKSHLVDLVVGDKEIMYLILYSLGKLQGNSILFSLKGLALDINEKLGIGDTPIDSLYSLLLLLNAQTSSSEHVLTALVGFITPSGPWSDIPLSEGLLCFFTQVLSSERELHRFTQLGGFKLLWANLVSSANRIGAGQICGSQWGLVSSVMNHLSPQLPAMAATSLQIRRVEQEDVMSANTTRQRSEIDAVTRGLYNFAPIANITSSSHTSRPADALVQNTPFFQRTKNPQWSYHFYPNENWVDLTLKLPCAILLHEIHLQPHTLSLGMSPAAVSVETSVDGKFFNPTTRHIIMAGLTYMKIIFSEPAIASAVEIRLCHPLEQSTLGLSQIKMYGTTAIKTLPRQNKLHDEGDVVSVKSSLWWLRLIHHCLYEVEDGLELGVKCALEMDAVIPSLVSLLTASTSSASCSSPGYAHTDSPLESIALALANSHPRLLNQLLEGLLKQPLFVHSLGSTAYDASTTLLYSICRNDRSNDGMEFMLNWLNTCASTYVQSRTARKKQIYITPILLRCIAAALWNTKADVSSLVTIELFKNVCLWRDMSFGNLSNGLNQIICSMCKLKPMFFLKTLSYMGILADESAPLPDASTSSERKEQRVSTCFTDDMKESLDMDELDQEINKCYLRDAHDIPLSSVLFRDLGVVCQSLEGANLLLDSGFLNLLVQGVLAWCKKELLRSAEPSEQEVTTESSSLQTAPVMTTSVVADTLDAFCAFALQLPLKEWLGCGEGGGFWLPLLTVLGDPTVRSAATAHPKQDRGNCAESNINKVYDRLEDATIKLMKECVLFHPENQKILASTLCHLIQKQKSPPQGGVTYLHSLSEFTRRLVLQVLLEGEYITVQVTTAQGVLNVPPSATSSLYLPHPQDGIGHHTRVLHLPAATSLEQVLNMVAVNGSASQSADTKASKRADTECGTAVCGVTNKGLGKVGLELVDKLYVAAGVSAKDKRHKIKVNLKVTKTAKKVESDNGSSPTEKARVETSPKIAGTYGLGHSGLLGGRSSLPPQMSLADVLSALRAAMPSNKIVPRLRFSLIQRAKASKAVDKDDMDKLLSAERFPSILETFTGLGGLSLLAQQMSLLYPDTSYQVLSGQSSSKCSSEDRSEPIVDHNSGSTNESTTNDAPIPPHSLGAFTLFLRLPGYAQTLLANAKNACSLLRLAFGANNIVEHSALGTDSGSQGDPLATLPFKVLEELLASTPHTTDDGRLLRKTCLKTGALHLILACLAALSHQASPEIIAALQHPNVPIGLVVASTRSSCAASNGPDPLHTTAPTTTSSKMENDRSHYWAKGTGFGTGSTNQNWNVEHSMQRQQMEEQHIIWLLRLLTQYINPSGSDNTILNTADKDNNQCQDQSLPEETYQLFLNSGLMTKIASYLSNDSVLDMSRHVPLYKALMQLILAIGVSSSIRGVLTHRENQFSKDLRPDLPKLLAGMMKTVNTYMTKLGLRSKHCKSKDAGNETPDETEEEEGLSLLVPHIRSAAALVEQLSENELQKAGGSELDGAQQCQSQTAHETYEKQMKLLQFDSYEMIVEDTDNSEVRFTVPYNYETSARKIIVGFYPHKRLKRLAQEVVTLSNSLPLSFSSSVFVRTDIDRIDVMKVLITGPEDTPYANGCFEFDVFFPYDYPQSPLSINLQTTGEKKVRFNPNLYQDGKVCLSILNTWHGRPEEKWSAHTSSLLQVLVSIQSLILVSEPYFNEPGYERSRGTPAGIGKSQEYDANIRVATVRYAILNQLKNPPACFKDVISAHFSMKRGEVMKQIDGWIRQMEGVDCQRTVVKNLSTHITSLKKLRVLVDEELTKLTGDKEPAGSSESTKEELPSGGTSSTEPEVIADQAYPFGPNSTSNSKTFASQIIVPPPFKPKSSFDPWTSAIPLGPSPLEQEVDKFADPIYAWDDSGSDSSPT